jgi:signal transduction histidine kinase
MKKQEPSYKAYLDDQDQPGILRFGGPRMVMLDVEAGFWNLRKQIETLVGVQLAHSTLKQAGINGGASFARNYISHTSKEDGPTAFRDCIEAYQAAGFGHYEITEIEWPIGHVMIQGTETFESWMFHKHHIQANNPVCSYTTGVLIGFVNVVANRDDVVCVEQSCQALGDDVCLFELLPAAQAGTAPVLIETPSQTLGSQLSLLEISRNIALDLELEPLLRTILDELKNVIDYDRGIIFSVDGRYLVVTSYREPLSNINFLLDNPLDSMVISERKPIVISDTTSDTPEAYAFRKSLDEKSGSALAPAGSWMGVPLIVKDRIIGELVLDHHKPNKYQPDDVELTFAYANQVAVAIENARLYQQAKQAAVLEERSRLARELHDSVSQSLYGIGLGARTVRKILDQESLDKEIIAKLTKPLDYVLQLANTGLAEMRALIFELHPDILERQGIVIALERQAGFIQTRHGIKVHTELCDEPSISFETKEAIYRIAQEALNNIVKHAQATQIRLHLKLIQGKVNLEIEDNGIGFEVSKEYPRHLGIRSMQERAQALDGTIEIHSISGQGTTLRSQIPMMQNPEK